MSHRASFRGDFRSFGFGLLVCLAATACGGGDDDDDFGKDVQGVYAIETWTKNPDACDVEGPDVAATESDKKLGIRRDEFIVPFVVVATCKDIDDCASRTTGSIFSALGGASLFEKKTANGYGTEGTLAWTTSSTGCSGKLLDQTLTKLGEGRVELRTGTHAFENVPVDGKDEDGNDECSSDYLRKIARDQPCTEFSVITALREADIPPKPSD